MGEDHSFVEQERLRNIAVKIDAVGRDTADLGELWQELIDGKLSILDHFSSRDRHYMTLRPAFQDAAAPALKGRQLELLQRLLLGQQQKGAAIDCHLSASTVAGTLAETLRALGLKNVCASRAPVLLSLLLHAHRQQAPVSSGRASEAFVDGRLVRVVSTPRLEESIGDKLSPAEQAVVRMRTDGKSHAEIAALRRTSRRTIANQIASASRKLGVSRRCELLRYLTRVAGETPVGSPPTRAPGYSLAAES